MLMNEILDRLQELTETGTNAYNAIKNPKPAATATAKPINWKPIAIVVGVGVALVAVIMLAGRK